MCKSIVLILLLVAVMATVTAQDDICDGIKDLHTVHGESLTAYLSAQGRECVESASASTAVLLNEKIWSTEGAGKARRTISLELTRGLYQLKAPLPPSNVLGGHAYITDIISKPESCFPWELVSFPATIRIERDCHILATVVVKMSFVHNDKRWALSIFKESNEIPPIPLAEEWSVSGRGTRLLPVALVFEPGIYSLNQNSGQVDARLSMLSLTPKECVRSVLRLPIHISVLRRCTVEADLYVSPRDNSRWSFDITKLD